VAGNPINEIIRELFIGASAIFRDVVIKKLAMKILTLMTGLRDIIPKV
jgi:hypothetical protein